MTEPTYESEAAKRQLLVLRHAVAQLEPEERRIVNWNGDIS